MVERAESRRSRRGALRPGFCLLTKRHRRHIAVSRAPPFFVMAAKAAIHASVLHVLLGSGRERCLSLTDICRGELRGSRPAPG